MFCVQIALARAFFSSSRSVVFRLRSIVALLFIGGLGLGGCAQRPQEVSVSHGKEYFPSSIYGRASRRVIADGQPVPHGGGQYLVGKPYSIAGRTYYPSESRATQVGFASWYGDAFHGRLTANGEIYDRDSFTAASPTMPLPSYARVTNLRNNYSMIVRVNDRGPYASDRIMDVSRRVAEALDYKRHGTAKVKVEYVGRAGLDGSDDSKLYATLRTNEPAPGRGDATLVATVVSRVHVASSGFDGPESASIRREEKLGHRGALGTETRSSRLTEQTDPQGPSAKNRRIALAVESERPQTDHLASRDRYDGNRPGRNLASNRLSFSRTSRAYAERQPRLAANDVALTTHASRVEQNRPSEFARSSHVTKLYQHARFQAVMPPSRPIDLGTIPGAATQIHAHREPPRLHFARSRED